jgi:hypothetical protein
MRAMRDMVKSMDREDRHSVLIGYLNYYLHCYSVDSLMVPAILFCHGVPLSTLDRLREATAAHRCEAVECSLDDVALAVHLVVHLLSCSHKDSQLVRTENRDKAN